MRKSTRRIFAIALAVVMVLTSMASAVFAAGTDNSTTYQDSANILKGYGVFVGDGSGNLMLNQQLTRQDAVVIALRLMGKKDAEFQNYTTPSDFTDITNPYYLPIIGMAQDLGLVEGMGDGTFGFDQLISAQQLETILLRSLGYQITGDIYANVPQMAQQEGITNLTTVSGNTEITRDIVAQMMLNTLNTNVKDSQVKLGVKLGFIQEKPPVAALEISSASAATDSSVKVTFNRAIEDTSKITFVLTGTAPIQTTVAWNNAKTEATLTAPSVLLAGAYTVKAAGDTFTAGKDTATLSVVANGAAKIQFANTNLVKAAGNTATLNFQITDNYGVDITKNVAASDLTIASSKTLSAAPFTLDANNAGLMTVSFTSPLDYLNADKTVSITIIDTKTGAAGTATLTSVAQAQADSVTLGAVQFPVTTPVTTKVLTANVTAAYIPVALKDQYGNAITDKNALGASDLLLIKSDSRMNLTLENYTDTNNNKGIRIDVDTTGITTAETATVTAVTSLAGKSSMSTLNIQEPAKPDKLSLGSATGIVAAQDQANTLIIPITAFDQYGVQLTPSDIASNANKFTVNGNGIPVAIATSGDYKGELVNTGAMPAKGTYVITVSTGTNVATSTVSINDKAYEQTIQVDTTPAANLLMGSVAKVNYKFVDQYGRAIQNPSAATVVKLSTGNANILKVNGIAANPADITTNAAAVAGSNHVSVTTNGNQGADTLTAKLYDQTGTSVLSTVSSSFNVTSGVPSSLTFSIADVPSINAGYAAAPAFSGVGANAQYAAVLNLIAKDANGLTYAIPSNRILGISSSDNTVVGVVQSADANATIKAQQGAMIVYGLTSAFQATDPSTATKTATVTVTVSTDNGPVQVTKTITVAKAAPAVAKVVIADTALDNTNPYVLATNAKVLTSISGLTSDITNQAAYIFTVDQYGVYTQINNPALTVVNMDRFTGTMGYANNKLVFNKQQILANQDVYVMYQAGNGVYGSLLVRASDGATTLDTTAPTATGDFTNANGAIVTVNFSKAMDPATLVQANFSSVAGGAITAFSIGANNQSVTMTFTTALVAGNTVAISNNVKDLAGNRIATLTLTK